jgi:thiamine pyrophosphokinase
LISSVNVGDTIVLSNVHKTLQNTVNVLSGSNVLFGHANSVNFINDLQEGDTIYLSTGNTTTIKTVTNSSYAIMNTIINVTSTSATVNVVYSEVTAAVSVNADTIITNTRFKANGNNLSAIIQKVR